jgi:3'-phosphoadenosine 5'-phosphosulfate sulfotransferase (PAPS reductase)/FAD synthetase
VAAKIATTTMADGLEPHVVYCDTGSEHPDNLRFLRDVEAWIGHPIEIIRSTEYENIWDVFRKTRWLIGPDGARCTAELKKVPRFAYQRPDDVQVFGYDSGEKKRVDRFRKENIGVDLRTPLIDRGLTKKDCLALVERAGIKIPAMYELGFRNANCMGCPKGGMGYWNKVRRVFPDVFRQMAEIERELDVAICKREGPGRERIRVFLDELDPEAGRDDEIAGECSLLCHAAEEELADGDPK